MTLLYDRLRAVVPTLPDSIPIIDASTIQQRINLLPDGLPQAIEEGYCAMAFSDPRPRFFEPSYPGPMPMRQAP